MSSHCPPRCHITLPNLSRSILDAKIIERHLPKFPDLETVSEGHFTWEVDNWSTLPKRLTGPAFEVGDTPWYSFRILLPALFILSSDFLVGEYYSSPTVITQIMLRCTWSTAFRTSHRRTGIDVFNSPSSCGIRTILPYTSHTVSFSPTDKLFVVAPRNSD